MVKWVQSDSQLMHTLSDGQDVDTIPSLNKFITECSGYTVDTSTVPLADKVGSSSQSLNYPVWYNVAIPQ